MKLTAREAKDAAQVLSGSSFILLAKAAKLQNFWTDETATA
jgi:hypothetical protein